ncbi:MAG: hypothetical protein B7Y97_06915 [Sphingomonas sp. 32-66-10]|nr:MAG: hypothetical protein B7Y97_06915 [Sphingomonas sp. 32-66-10]
MITRGHQPPISFHGQRIELFQPGILLFDRADGTRRWRGNGCKVGTRGRREAGLGRRRRRGRIAAHPGLFGRVATIGRPFLVQLSNLLPRGRSMSFEPLDLVLRRRTRTWNLVPHFPRPIRRSANDREQFGINCFGSCSRRTNRQDRQQHRAYHDRNEPERISGHTASPAALHLP